MRGQALTAPYMPIPTKTYQSSDNHYEDATKGGYYRKWKGVFSVKPIKDIQYILCLICLKYVFRVDWLKYVFGGWGGNDNSNRVSKKFWRDDG